MKFITPQMFHVLDMESLSVISERPVAISNEHPTNLNVFFNVTYPDPTFI
jgi:hypothetical protein